MENLLTKVKQHHCTVEERLSSYTVLMTVLIGSNNYHLDGPNSDIDTVSFILPSFRDFVTGVAPKSGEWEVNDGKCIYKDLRLAFNLLRKPSPNSIECFTSHYKVYNPLFEKVLESYLDDDYTLYYLTHANYTNMVNAIAGCARGVHGRNMTIGKQFSHILRLHDMLIRYLDRKYRPREYLELDPANLHVALATKFNLLPVTEQSCKNLSDTLSVFAKNFIPTTTEKVREEVANKVIDEFQLELTEIYLDDAKKHLEEIRNRNAANK